MQRTIGRDFSSLTETPFTTSSTGTLPDVPIRDRSRWQYGPSQGDALRVLSALSPSFRLQTRSLTP
jgi:hypothetical protein